MNQKKSIWQQADSFLSLSRKIIINGATVLILVVITFTVIGGVASSFSGSDEIDKKDKILWFKPIGVVVDNSISSSSSIDALLGSAEIQQHKLEDLLNVLKSAANDEELSAVYINVTELGMYYASAFELANAVKNIKDNGKRVIAYGDTFGNNAYLISSQANEIILNKYGQIASFGFSRKREYVKDLYQNIKLNQHVFVAGEWKTGPENFTRNSMSAEDKISWNDFAEPLWNKITNYIENAREHPKGTLQNYGDAFWQLSKETPEVSQIALERNLVDKVFTVEELRHWFFEEYPNEDDDANKLPDAISIYDPIYSMSRRINFSPLSYLYINLHFFVI